MRRWQPSEDLGRSTWAERKAHITQGLYRETQGEEQTSGREGFLNEDGQTGSKRTAVTGQEREFYSNTAEATDRLKTSS